MSFSSRQTVGGERSLISSRLTLSGGGGLDLLNLFVANIQTGFGPFIAVYLTTIGWTQTTIGLALSVGTIAAMASQIPAGALVDMAKRKSVIAGLSLLAFSTAAMMFAVQPGLLSVMVAEVLHGFASCTLGPCIAAMSIALVSHSQLAARFARNARFSSIGNALGAALMGAFGYYVSTRSVFFLAAALTFPAIALVFPLRKLDALAPPLPHVREAGQSLGTVAGVLGDRRLLIFAACQLLFTLANAAMLPIASGTITEEMPASANLVIAAFIVLPQLVVAAVSHRVGRYAQSHGRRLVMIAALAALTLRGVLFAVIANPFLLVPIQILDGVSAACNGILVPLVTADVAGHTHHYNFSLGVIGFAVGIGATVSTTVAGMIADRVGEPTALMCLSVVAFVATVFTVLLLPETRAARMS